jgi:5-deoxy-glucuronate isomerase
MNEEALIVHPNPLPAGQAGELLSLSRERAAWEWMSFSVRRHAEGEVWESQTVGEEAVLVLLSGRCIANWGEGEQRIGQRRTVFDGLPYALYLPAGTRIRLQPTTECEVADCRVPSQASFRPRIITPQDVRVSLRGGGNASRQIVDVVPPDSEGDKLIAVEVYTPGGNWSSYPPHKHDIHSPPQEADLEEIYYYRVEKPGGFAYQRLYTPDRGRDETLLVRDGDVVLVREGYHPVVAGHGYNIYYLNFLAGSMRALAATEDPEHTWVRSTWKGMDPRLPMVRGSGP